MPSSQCPIETAEGIIGQGHGDKTKSQNRSGACKETASIVGKMNSRSIRYIRLFHTELCTVRNEEGKVVLIGNGQNR